MGIESSMRKHLLAFSLTLISTQIASASTVFFFSDPSGLSAEAEFTLLDPMTIEIRLRNTSTGVPMGFDNSDQILTGVSWDFGHVGFNGDAMITGGTVVIGPTSNSVNFEIGNSGVVDYGPGTDVSGEYGYGNMDGTGAFTNFITAHHSQATPFMGMNLDGPGNIDGPEGGLVASPPVLPLGGLGAIEDEIIATITISLPLASESEIFGDLGLVRVEWGSDAAFITVPEPGSLGLLLLGGLVLMRRRRRSRI